MLVEKLPGRLVSLDVFRGIVIAAMILVTDPGTYSYVYSPLRHAEWMGATATDMIFPAFLFMVGLAISFSFASQIKRGVTRTRLIQRLLRRSLVLFVLGLVLNGFPDYHLATLRIPGILQRIAICYLLSGALYLFTTRQIRLLAGVAFALLAGYWALLKLVPVPGIGPGHLDTFGSLPAYIDRQLFGINHLWIWGLTPRKGVTYDPEGLLSTLPAMFSTLAGIVAGDWMRSDFPARKRVLGLAIAGCALWISGLLLSPLLPLNKRIWTSTFALMSTGVSVAVFAALYAVIDLGGFRRGLLPAKVLGTNAILAFTLSTIITSLLDRIYLHGLTLHEWLYQNLFASWLPPYPSSLAYAIVIVLLNILLLYPLYQRQLFVRV
ncbi:MAG TPA: heparan-alpha-glucosaminide N-acetyltransferase domain-containing protein [Acidobacteriaceae bacterium]|nr:heparan-alpha-glucosaminide N-acetyltransferase domain-containing protein [Acidobacteriaceae bacterium]